jgi:hypothetical protein
MVIFDTLNYLRVTGESHCGLTPIDPMQLGHGGNGYRRRSQAARDFDSPAFWEFMDLHGTNVYIYRHNYTQYIYILLYIYVCIISIYTLLYPSTMIQKVII